ncbi:NAD(P)H-dependent oxidoreductase [Flavobacterium chungangense]|uniref:NADPH-dependent FMN reductase n=1 Tax=Flavobacterium chungangense TaxID=554283 RepID=A0A6V6YNB7_9FLAO|nr:NAD(P)H-dependent oxidoreductase [Flavobacterium chungangense]CAD0000998.1 hypothetical protein FLACHUCJ7_00323 [Flavobacterium chungangense]
MENKKVIILGSSRKNGNTTKIVDEISKENNLDVVNLSDYTISYYDYESKNIGDDFLPLIKKNSRTVRHFNFCNAHLLV